MDSFAFEKRGKTSGGGAPGLMILKGLLSAIVLLFGVFMISSMFTHGQYAFAILFTIVIAGGLLVTWMKGMYPHRYIFPSIAGMVVFIIFPLVYTVYIAFTNYSAKNLFTLERAENYFLSQTYRIEGGDYQFKLYAKEGNKYVIVLNNQPTMLADGNPSEVRTYASPETVFFDKDQMEKPSNKTTASKTVIHVTKVDNSYTQDMEDCGIKCKAAFRDYLKSIKIKIDAQELTYTGLNTFSAVKNRFVRQDQVVLGNQETLQNSHMLKDVSDDSLIIPDMNDGYYKTIDTQTGEPVGERMAPGFRVYIGFEHFKRIFNDPSISTPFVKIFIWTVCFAALTVFITLAIGMVLACLVQWEFLKGRGIYRLILILPYAVPSFISILVFKGLFNENFGEINRILDFFLGWRPEWYNEAGYARAMILLVNAWLGYPYMMILCMGLLKSIPDDLYEASAMDGSGPVQNFMNITLPLLMKPLTPLLIASFAFNFNNFVLIMLLTNGGPDFLPEDGVVTTAGSTDLLVSYTYRLAFEGGAGGNDYGLASAIATTIFILVGALSIVNLKISKMGAKD